MCMKSVIPHPQAMDQCWSIDQLAPDHKRNVLLLATQIKLTDVSIIVKKYTLSSLCDGVTFLPPRPTCPYTCKSNCKCDLLHLQLGVLEPFLVSANSDFTITTANCQCLV